jgi:hypothetical protein
MLPETNLICLWEYWEFFREDMYVLKKYQQTRAQSASAHLSVIIFYDQAPGMGFNGRKIKKKPTVTKRITVGLY